MRSRVIPGLALAVAGVSVAVLAPGALATSTHQEYVAQVNPICKNAARQAKKIPNRVKKSGNPFIDALRRTGLYAKLLGRTIRRIAAVEPAPGEEARVKSWLKSDRRTVRLIRRFLRSVKRGDLQRARALIPKIVRSQRKNRKKAAALGLPACSKAARQPA